jgi:hypothetical protein
MAAPAMQNLSKLNQATDSLTQIMEAARRGSRG